MPRPGASDRYSGVSIVLHWLMVLLFVAVYSAIELREYFPKGSEPREALKSLHFTLGLSVFVLVWLRIAARIAWPAPAAMAPSGAARRMLPAIVHLALYGIMIGMPLAGWLILSAEAKPVPFFGMTLPPLVGTNEALAEQVEEAHELVGTVGYYLIGLHALAALVHHYLLRDKVLRRMLPARI